MVSCVDIHNVAVVEAKSTGGVCQTTCMDMDEVVGASGIGVFGYNGGVWRLVDRPTVMEARVLQEQSTLLGATIRGGRGTLLTPRYCRNSLPQMRSKHLDKPIEFKGLFDAANLLPVAFRASLSLIPLNTRSDKFAGNNRFGMDHCRAKRTAVAFTCSVRHGPVFYNCSITLEPTEVAVVHLSEDDQGLAAGQFAAFYQENTCLGSGLILDSWDVNSFPICSKALKIAQMKDKSKIGKPVRILNLDNDSKSSSSKSDQQSSDLQSVGL
ncbi:hypothetical protein KSP40_PGU017182 [Platanthera guangdongensis]|uniref:tRNA-specific 2-thiouridylase MnmA-like C-terminal domain-containing protein n=1 Tax=Platanthera guangdongensis TaxID=2320717 RepID=A0ABR2LL31_9ASPA